MAKAKGKQNSGKLEFTIIAGDLKGRKISAPDLGVTRPPLSRLRRAIFDFLNPHLRGVRYLDLFSGAGSYMFEAASRGAAEVVGVELESGLTSAINTQAEKLGVGDTLKAVTGDVFDVVPRLHGQGREFDIVMIAPPQYQKLIDRTLVMLREHPVVSQSGLILCQHDSSETEDLDIAGFAIDQRRKYGNTTYTVLSGKPTA